MKKAELIDKLSKESGVAKADVISVLDAFSNVLAVNVKRNGDQIAYPGMGIFKQKLTKERVGRNPATGSTITTPAKETVVFKPSKELKSTLETNTATAEQV